MGEGRMKSKYIISTNGAKIAYNVFGKGSPLVLVHGMGSNKEMWVENEIKKNNIALKYLIILTM